ncbi:hypothetical protein LTS10_004342 [Elasticomyces elasticus]|nr:hypothetical protein LTS10_004342 [Elasticomyces elasticus]
MQYSLTCLALAALAVAKAMPQGVTSAVSPSTSAPADCKASYDGTFSIQTVNVTTASKVKRQADDTLVMTLADGILKDAKGRTGYIADNRQFQFDGPPQTGAVYTAGWSVCSNGSLTIGDDSVFYQCLSGTFYNLYDENYLNAAQCSQVYINVIAGSGSSSVASQSADGQITASPVASAASQLPDGQPQATTAATALPSQISDGQVQATTAATAAPAVSIISDGQIQATTAATAAPTTAAPSPISQISDGQVQATTAAPAPMVSQIGDGQIQAPTTSTVAGAAQASDGQVQASVGANSTFSSPSASVLPYTGNAMSLTIADGLFGVVAAVMAVAML